MKRVFSYSKGQFMVLYAGMIAASLGATALCTDVAIMYQNHIQLQKATDSAAIAGANYLTGLAYTGTAAGCTGQSDDAKKAACTYALSNGIDTTVTGTSLNITEPTATTIKVDASRTGLPYFFGKVIGLSSYTVSVTSIAQASLPVGTADDLFPVGLQCAPPCTASSLVAGQPVSFGAKFVGGLSSGNWQWLDPSAGHGGGASALASAIAGSYSGSFTVGGNIWTEPGNKANSGQVTGAFTARMNSCDSYGSDPCSGKNPIDLLKSGDPCLVIVPVVNFGACGNGACGMAIEGFAQIYIEPATSTVSSIQGCYVNGVAANTVGSKTAPALGPVMPPVLIQ